MVGETQELAPIEFDATPFSPSDAGCQVVEPSGPRYSKSFTAGLPPPAVEGMPLVAELWPSDAGLTVENWNGPVEANRNGVRLVAPSAEPTTADTSRMRQPQSILRHFEVDASAAASSAPCTKRPTVYRNVSPGT
jgi:hypothetical protein